jgi:hypothetical protein
LPSSTKSAEEGTVEKLFDDWIIQLPKVLWELGANNLTATEVSACVEIGKQEDALQLLYAQVILRVLLRLAQRRSRTDSLTVRPLAFASLTETHTSNKSEHALSEDPARTVLHR